MKNIKNLLAALMLTSALFTGLHAAAAGDGGGGGGAGGDGEDYGYIDDNEDPRVTKISDFWFCFCSRDDYGDERNPETLRTALMSIEERDFEAILELLKPCGCFHPLIAYRGALAFAAYARKYPKSLTLEAFEHFVDNTLGKTAKDLPVALQTIYGHETPSLDKRLKFTKLNVAIIIIQKFVNASSFRDFMDSGHLAKCVTSLSLQHRNKRLSRDVFALKVCRWTETKDIVRLRALVLGGRAACITRGNKEEMVIIQWLCARAPLWVVIRVIELLQENTR